MNTMLRFFLIIALTTSSLAFTVTPLQSITSGRLDALAVTEMVVKNRENDTLYLTMVKSIVKAPQSWSASFCVGTSCYPDFLDTTTITILPQDSIKVTLDVTPSGNSGWGYYSLQFINTKKNSDTEKLFFATTTETRDHEASDLTITESTPSDTNVLYNTSGTFHAMVINNASYPRDITTIKESVALPDDASFSLCANSKCYPPFLDTVPTVTVNPSDTLFIDLSFTSGQTSGDIAQRVSLVDETDSVSIDKLYTLSISNEKSPITSFAKTNLLTPHMITQHGKLSISNISGTTVEIQLYSLKGILLKKVQHEVTNGSISVDLTNFASGQYVIRLQGAQLRLLSTINLVK